MIGVRLTIRAITAAKVGRMSGKPKINPRYVKIDENPILNIVSTTDSVVTAKVRLTGFMTTLPEGEDRRIMIKAINYCRTKHEVEPSARDPVLVALLEVVGNIIRSETSQHVSLAKTSKEIQFTYECIGEPEHYAAAFVVQKK